MASKYYWPKDMIPGITEGKVKNKVQFATGNVPVGTELIFDKFCCGAKRKCHQSFFRIKGTDKIRNFSIKDVEIHSNQWDLK